MNRKKFSCVVAAFTMIAAAVLTLSFAKKNSSKEEFAPLYVDYAAACADYVKAVQDESPDTLDMWATLADRGNKLVNFNEEIEYHAATGWKEFPLSIKKFGEPKALDFCLYYAARDFRICMTKGNGWFFSFLAPPLRDFHCLTELEADIAVCYWHFGKG